MADVMTMTRPERDVRWDTEEELQELHMTEEEFLAWMDEDVRAEFVDGKVEILMAGNEDHEDIGGFLFTLMNLFVQQKGVGHVFFNNFMVRLRRGLRRIPDIHFIEKSRLDQIHRTEVEGYSDLIVEIVSDDSVDRDRREKFHDYQAAGVREYWIVDPVHRRLDIYVLNDNHKFEPLSLDGNIYRSRVLGGFWLRPEWLWQRPLPNVVDIAREIGII
jgi:Uma2 family endonuclease